jgi:hypothetical protein
MAEAPASLFCDLKTTLQADARSMRLLVTRQGRAPLEPRDANKLDHALHVRWPRSRRDPVRFGEPLAGRERRS